MPNMISLQDQISLIMPAMEIKIGGCLQRLTAPVYHQSLYCKGF
jgi:hypothetical protein